jgi:hypothetical protein
MQKGLLSSDYAIEKEIHPYDLAFYLFSISSNRATEIFPSIRSLLSKMKSELSPSISDFYLHSEVHAALLSLATLNFRESIYYDKVIFEFRKLIYPLRENGDYLFNLFSKDYSLANSNNENPYIIIATTLLKSFEIEQSPENLSFMKNEVSKWADIRYMANFQGYIINKKVKRTTVKTQRKFHRAMSFKHFKSLLIGIAGIVVVYGVLNLILVGGQSLWHSGDNKKLDQLKAELETENVEIERYESTAKTRNLSVTEINDYKRKIDEYNKNVEEANKLAKEIGTTWYVVPVPGHK